jgi:hypothetical protein
MAEARGLTVEVDTDPYDPIYAVDVDGNWLGWSSNALPSEEGGDHVLFDTTEECWDWIHEDCGDTLL